MTLLPFLKNNCLDFVISLNLLYWCTRFKIDFLIFFLNRTNVLLIMIMLIYYDKVQVVLSSVAPREGLKTNNF